MATAYYYAAHFPLVHTNTIQSPSPPPTNPTFSVHAQTPHIPAAAAKTERADSVIPATSLAQGDAMNEQKESIFFRLPAELRNQIYEELLSGGTPHPKILPTLTRLPTPAPTYPAILSSCRRIQNEATHLLYATHIFHAHPSLLTALPHLTAPSKPVLYPTVLRLITRWQLTVRLDTDPRFSFTQAKRAFSGAEYFELRVWQSTFDGCGADVLKLFTGVRGVRVCKVLGSVDEGLARWLEGVMMGPVEEREEDGLEWCDCKGERYVKCCGCERRVRNGAWFDERDAWRFGNR
jgi:hypothetical protein